MTFYSESHITRLDYERCRGWMVRIQRTLKKGVTLFSKFFGDASYGSPRKALKAARIWRDDTLVKVPPPKGRHTGQVVPPGYGYVRKTVIRYTDGHGVCHSYRAWVGWLRIEDRKCLTTKWSIDKWGNQKARRFVDEWLEASRRDLRKRMRRRKPKC